VDGDTRLDERAGRANACERIEASRAADRGATGGLHHKKPGDIVREVVGPADAAGHRSDQRDRLELTNRTRRWPVTKQTAGIGSVSAQVC
jgi:hypothetical protein